MDNISKREWQLYALRNEKIKLKDEKHKKTTMGRFHIRILPMVVFCMFMLPLILSFFLREQDEQFRKTENFIGKELSDEEGDYYVTCTRPSGTLKIPMEDYLVGKLCHIMEQDSPREAMMAMAVLLRTQVVYETEQIGVCEVESVYTLEELDRMYKEKTGEGIPENYTQAVYDTRGIIITYQGTAIETAYHRISAGMTRDAKEMFGDRFLYLRSADCEEDMLADSYFHKYTYSREEFFGFLQKLTGNHTLTQAEVIIDERDAAGYVLSVTIQGEGFDSMCVGGETFRKIFSLSSSHFEITENDENVIFSCKGVGHGYGLSLYKAGLLADEGWDFMEIIRYFYKDIEFMRIA